MITALLSCTCTLLLVFFGRKAIRKLTERQRYQDYKSGKDRHDPRD
jgi:hypothetical protein